MGGAAGCVVSYDPCVPDRDTILIALVIGAVSERFITPQVEREVEKGERETAAEVEQAEDELLRELQGISARLLVIEASFRERRA